MERLSRASIHGRFQPFHNGHLRYFEWARARATLVYIGVTQIYNQHGGDFPGAEHRGQLSSNPLTYFERQLIIESALIGEGYKLDEFRVVPFPIEDPFRLTTFMPTDIACFTTRHSEWNDHKIQLLREAGYEVAVLQENESDIPRVSGTELRKLIREGNVAWRQYVPAGVGQAIDAGLIHRFLEQ